MFHASAQIGQNTLQSVHNISFEIPACKVLFVPLSELTLDANGWILVCRKSDDDNEFTGYRGT